MCVYNRALTQAEIQADQNTPVNDAPAPPPPPPSAIQLVQKAVNGSEPSVPTIAASFPSSVTALGPVTDGPQDVTAYVWYVPASLGGPNTVTLTPTSARALEIHVSEWAGLATVNPLDQTAVASGFGVDASSGARTTTVGGELVFGYTFMARDATAGAGFTPLSLVNGDLDEYFIQPAAGPVAATFLQDAGADWFVLMATFTPAVVPQ